MQAIWRDAGREYAFTSDSGVFSRGRIDYGSILLVQALPIDDTCVTLEPAQLVPAVHVLIHQCGLYHLSAITADDTGDGISLLYHFWDGHGLTLRTVLPAEQPVIATLTDLIPGASFYEREAAEMLGVTFEGAAPAGPLLLPDDWDGPPPLLRSAPEQEAAP